MKNEEWHLTMDRREFLSLAAGTVALAAFPSRMLGANDRIRIGLIGAGDRGHAGPERCTGAAGGRVCRRGGRLHVAAGAGEGAGARR